MGISRKAVSNNKGQASIFVALMVATLLSFFTFVVSVGVLVNAKINLQNAADMAAYAGAAVQARQLNSIAWLNYEMRRQFKRYLFRYFVVGSAQQEGFPSDNGSGRATFSPSPTGQPYNVPIVCINFNDNDNICQLNKVPEIPEIKPGFLDSIGQAFAQQLDQFKGVTAQNCKFISDVNQKALMFWLFNSTDEDLRTKGGVFPPNINFIVQQLAGLVSGLGVVPNELLLARRIRTLETYVNLPAGTYDLQTISDLTSGGGGADLALNERPIQAFLSAINTLGEHTFNAKPITMTEILPQGGKPLLDLKETKIDFDSLYLETDQTTSTNPRGCTQFARNIRVQELPIGFHKTQPGGGDSAPLVFYAVQLKAKANLLFSPFGDIEMKAYAAAKPFGSRIGPEISPDDFRIAQNPSIGGAVCPGGQCLIPNLQLVTPSSGGQTLDFFSTETLRKFFAATPKLTSSGGKQIINGAGIDYASFVAQAPNPAELGKYMIPVDIMDNKSGKSLPPLKRKGGVPGGDPSYQLFRDKPDDKGVPVPMLDIWAPLFDEQFNAEAIKAELEPILQGSLPGNTIFKDILLNDILSYVGKIRNQEGENGETFQIYRMPNPYMYPKDIQSKIQPDPPPVRIKPPGTIVVDADPLIRDSFPATRNRNFKALGRVGYSVKLVAFDYLFRNDLGWSNIDAIRPTGTILPDIKDSKKLRH